MISLVGRDATQTSLLQRATEKLPEVRLSAIVVTSRFGRNVSRKASLNSRPRDSLR